MTRSQYSTEKRVLLWDDGDFHPIPVGAVKVPLPAIRQETEASCGAAALQSVCCYYGVGPLDQWEYVRDLVELGMDETKGADPLHLRRVAERYGLTVEERSPMTREELTRFLEEGKPVLIMVQSWGDRPSYEGVWDDGHWLVAIGYDETGVFFVDPTLEGLHGYISYEDLEQRWHDIDEADNVRKYVNRYGMVLWRPGVEHPAYMTKAYRIP